jgi:hypothetical protein
MRLGHPDVECYTLQEAMIEWSKLPPHEQQQASIAVAGRIYSADKIDRLHKK